MGVINITQQLMDDLKDFRSRKRLPYWDIVDVYCDKERVAMIADDFLDRLIGYLPFNPTREWVQSQVDMTLAEARHEEGEGSEHLKMEIQQVLDLLEPYQIGS